MNQPVFVILAGGEGKRFAPLVINKTIFPFMGKPLLAHQLEQLARVGIKDVLIATNDENHDWINTFQLDGLRIRVKRQPTPLGMADALINLAAEVGSHPMVVMNAVDVVDDSLLTALLGKIDQQPYGLVTGIRVKEYFPGGYLQLSGDQVTQVVEKPGSGNEPSDLVNLVFHYFSQPQEFISQLKTTQSDADDIYELALSKLMAVHAFGFVPYDGYWSKLKYPHFVLDVMELFLTHRLQAYRHPSAQISPLASLNGVIYIEEGVTIQAGAVVQGPVYLGKNVTVGNGSLVRHSMIEAGTNTGFGTEVARSYLGPGCALHHNFIGDSVLEAAVNPSYGTTTTNWRLDQAPIKLKTLGDELDTGRTKLGAILAKGVFSGANCTFLPGVTVGAGTHIYPNTVIYQAVPANRTLKSYQQQVLA